MAKTKKQKAKQKEAPAEQPKAKQQETTVSAKQESVTEKTDEKEEVKQHRPPQMVTVNGEKVTHGHAFQSNRNPDDWFFTARIDGVALRPQLMSAEDAKLWQDRNLKIEDAMQHYYPTKIQKKVTPEEFKADNKLSDGRIIDKMVVYKEHDEQSPDVGRYKLYTQVGDQKMSRTMSREDLNAYFDRVTTPAKLVEKNFGEQLHLASFYKKFNLPEGVTGAVVHKNYDGKWCVKANAGGHETKDRELSWNDRQAYFKFKTATPAQLAAKNIDFSQPIAQKRQQSRGLKV